MRAMVFAAGLGTRLRPLTDVLPKPVVPFFGLPLAGWTLAHLRRAGVQSVVANTHHLAARCEEALAAAVPAGLTLRFSREDGAILGTGGGLRRAVEIDEAAQGAMQEDDVLLAVNGDILFAPDVAALIAHHRQSGAMATMALRAVPDPFSLGAIEIAPDGRVVGMLRRAGDPRAPGVVAAMFTGVHVLSRAAVKALPTRGCIVRQGYERWLAEGAHLQGIVCSEPWRDLGTLRVYLDTHLDVLAGKLALPGVEPGPRWVGPRAEISQGARLDRVVVGAGARVGPVRLSRVVVWPGARVTEDAEDAVVLPEGRIVAV
ncbi:MAG: NDP-sugar synthase [Sandaracinaceae bacterium]